jgi:hypothetical protein
MGQHSKTYRPFKGWFVFFISLFLVTLTGVLIALSFYKKNFSVEQHKVLQILSSDSGKIYFRQPVNDNSEFEIEFIHSVNNSAVLEKFSVNGQLIKPVSVRFHSFGAGMNSELEEGQKMEIDGDAIIVSGFTKTFNELEYIVGTVSDHKFIIGGDIISLRELCGKNAHIKIKIR